MAFIWTGNKGAHGVAHLWSLSWHDAPRVCAEAFGKAEEDEATARKNLGKEDLETIAFSLTSKAV
jgi:hypothetical protein